MRGKKRWTLVLMNSLNEPVCHNWITYHEVLLLSGIVFWPREAISLLIYAVWVTTDMSVVWRKRHISQDEKLIICTVI